MKKDKILVTLSGGQDSVTVLYCALEEFGSENIIALSFDYGQRHKAELLSAKIIAQKAKVQHEIMDLGPIFAGLSPLTNPTEKVEAYDSAEKLPKGLEKTFIPGRNVLFLTLAANRAVAHGAKAIAIGVSADDAEGYPDCRKDFLKKMADALRAGVDQNLVLYAPLLDKDKKATVLMAKEIPGCWEALEDSHTCYNGFFPPCGKCHSCLLRAKGFTEAGLSDPLIEKCHREAVSAIMGDSIDVKQ